MKKIPDFMVNATNVYRTKNYIVKQVMGIRHDPAKPNVVFSFDIYYRRTIMRDFQYQQIFRDKENLNGKRLPTTMYSRTYIE